LKKEPTFKKALIYFAKAKQVFRIFPSEEVFQLRLRQSSSLIKACWPLEIGPFPNYRNVCIYSVRGVDNDKKQ
jgi:hypothetical protein